METYKTYIQKIALFTYFLIAALAVSIWSYFHYDGNISRTVASEAKGKKQKKIFIAVDGLSRETFDYARDKLGYFKMFSQVSSHVAPFPSISDYSWNIMMHAREVNGARGAIGYYEGNFYDYRKNQLMADPREYFRRIGSNDLYFNGFFDYYLNPYIEALLYFPTQELPKMELEQLQESIFESGDKPLVTVMVASVDALAHTRADSLDFLSNLNLFLINIQTQYAQNGVDAEIIIVSDHGQASRTKPGEELQPLLPINMKPAFARAGLKESLHLVNDNDVVAPVMALGNYISLSFKDLSKREDLVKELSKEEWFQHAVYVVPTENYDPQKMTIAISDKSGSAELVIMNYPENPTYRYIPKTGNPLHVNENAHNITLSDRQAREITISTPYPDSFFRLAQMAKQEEAVMPDMIVTMSDSFRVSGQFDKMTSMFQTHGSLSRRSSMGLVATTKESRILPKEIRSKDVLAFLEINPKEIAKTKKRGFDSTPKETFNLLSQPGYKGIETGAGTFTNERIFGIINNAVNYSRYVFDMPTISSLAETFKPIVETLSKVSPETTSVSDLNLDLDNMEIDKVLSTKDFGLITDLIIKHGDIDKIQKDPKFIALKNRLTIAYDKVKARHETPGNESINSFADMASKLSPYSRAGKRITMKAYSTTFLLEKALTLPEFPYIEDDRDLTFWKKWQDSRADYISSPSTIQKQNVTAAKLFHEIFLEQQYAEDISPLSLPLLYNRGVAKDVTIVYVPGIYNSIFDNEIFQIGLDSLVNNLGVRILEAPVLSACSSNYNADLILSGLKKDIAYRAERNLSPQKYFFMGYSKGGVDTLHALNKADPSFIQKNILGVLTIASPISGSSILNRTDLPISLLGLLSPEVVPEICHNEEKASNSITPIAAQQFLQKNAAKLVGLTRYYSISFKSNIKDSHLFMKATKDIAGFTEANDGVVTVSSARFPENFKAVDLGVVEGDHLAGIVASKFPQQAFMQSLYMTLMEFEAFNPVANEKFNSIVRYESPLYNGEFHSNNVSGILGDKDSVNKMLESAKTMSESERKNLALKIEEMIKNAVKETPYAAKDFNVNISKTGKIELVLAKPTEDNRFMMMWKSKEKIEVNNADQIIKTLLSKLQKSGKNLLAANVELWRTYPISERPKIVLPANDLGYNEDFRINLRELDKFMKGKKINPMLPSEYPAGVSIIYDHRRVVDFRTEYQFNYESTAPINPDDHETSGWNTIMDANKGLKARLASDNSSIRMTSYALRFKPQDFPVINWNLQVDKSVPGANVLFGGSGKDDSAFQVWFTLRELKPGTDRTKLDSSEKMRLFGYYFGDEVPGTKIAIDQVYENYYSKKNFIIAVLPEAKQIPIGVGPVDLKKPLINSKNFMEDLRRSFPDINPELLEVVSITIQHDSNDTKSSSEAIFKEISFKPLK